MAKYKKWTPHDEGWLDGGLQEKKFASKGKAKSFQCYLYQLAKRTGMKVNTELIGLQVKFNFQPASNINHNKTNGANADGNGKRKRASRTTATAK